ncbi:MAG: hypothetical protein RR482_03050 [Clostridia bacterium]
MKYLRRLLWFCTVRLFWLNVISGILIMALYFSMNVTNILILLEDGMAARARVVLMHEDPGELNKFFQQDFLDRDEALRIGQSAQSPYADYDIRGIDHRVSMEWMWSWPWEDTARADIVESVPAIDGKIKASLRAAAIAENEKRLYPPPWNTARYRATLVRIDGQWKIASLKLMETLPEAVTTP